MRDILRRLFPVALVLTLLSGDPAQAATTSYIARLARDTGLSFQLRVYAQISRFETEVENGIPDLVFLNPYHMLVAHEAQGYRPLVRDSEHGLTGILVVRQTSGIRRLDELNHKVVAFPSPNAFGASLYMRALLKEKENVQVQPVYVGTHQNVYRQVLMGDVVAGGGVISTLAKEPAAVRDQLSILYTTPETAPHPLAVHPRVPAAVAGKIEAALLALHSDPEGAKLLAAAQMPKPMVANYHRDYEHLQRLRLDRYAVRHAR
jgi:phosphonate transport system substrate-binding protein